ncbi:MAG: amino acid permease, partial [Endozoicomonadaceae bacterium]|nr:amino acid permease [Endozoicomonadaceae bacterium]
MNKKIKLFDAVLMSVCITLALGSVAPAASIGLSSIFWWILLLIIFFYPYGLVTAELGTAYPEDGGIYDWIKLAYGRVWGARVTWYYWINYAFGMGSNGILFALFIQKMTGCKFSPLLISVIALIFVWLSAWLGMLKISQNIWILNIGAACKAFVILTLVFAGVYSAFTAAKLANSFSFDSLKPDFSVGMRFLPMIIFNLLGFEVITSVAGNMQNPGRQIPKAIIIGGILIAFFYVVSTVG